MLILPDCFWPKGIIDVSDCLTNDDLFISKRLRIFRVGGTIILTAIYLHSYFELSNNYIRLIIGYNYWGLLFTTMTFISLIIVSETQANDFPRAIHKLAFILFELSWTSEIVITIIFWVITAIMDRVELKSYSTILHTLECNLLPIVLLSIDFVFNKIEFIMSHGILLSIIPLLYFFISLFFSLKYDVHEYSILTWKDYKTFFGIALFTFFYIMGFLSGHLLGKYKKEPTLALADVEEKIVWPESKDLTYEPKLEDGYGTFRGYKV